MSFGQATQIARLQNNGNRTMFAYMTKNKYIHTCQIYERHQLKSLCGLASD